MLKAFGVKLGPRARRFTFAERVRQAVAHDLLLTEVSETLLRAWSTLIIEHNRLDALLRCCQANAHLSPRAAERAGAT